MTCTQTRHCLTCTRVLADGEVCAECSKPFRMTSDEAYDENRRARQDDLQQRDADRGL